MIELNARPNHARRWSPPPRSSCLHSVFARPLRTRTAGQTWKQEIEHCMRSPSILDIRTQYGGSVDAGSPTVWRCSDCFRAIKVTTLPYSRI